MDKLVYVSAQHYASGEALDILTPKALDELLSSGWTIADTSKVQVRHPKTKKMVMVEKYRLVQASSERGVAVVGRPDHSRNISVTMMPSMQEGPARGLSIPGQNDDGYLGKSIAGAIPGVRVVSSLAKTMAFGMGTDAGKTGCPADSCPFGEGTGNFADWMDGYFQGGGACPPMYQEALVAGRNAAKGPAHLEVSCPYPPRSWNYCAWLAGFRQAGGKVEGG